PSKGRAPGFLDARQVPSCARDAAAGQGPAGIARARPIWMNPPHRRRRSRGQRASAIPLPCRAAPSSLFPSAASGSKTMPRDISQRIAAMVQRLKFYIDGKWQDPVSTKTLRVINPANEEPLYEIAVGSKADVDKAVVAARRAFESFSLTKREERADLLAKIIEVYKKRMKEIGAAISDEMGAPLGFAERFQAGAGLGHLLTTLEVLRSYPFEERLGAAMLVREPVGVAGMITPWNWPL